MLWAFTLLARELLAQGDLGGPSAQPQGPLGQTESVRPAVKLALIPAPARPRFTLGARYKWVAKSSVSPVTVGGFMFSSALTTARNAPVEYGPHWDGYAKRIGLRISTGATSRIMEASLGALWHEDPRYVRTTGRGAGYRLLYVVRMAVMAHNERGDVVPAYARYITVPANSFLSNAWRPDSQTSMHDSLVRVPLSFMDRIIANTFSEFWPRKK